MKPQNMPATPMLARVRWPSGRVVRSTPKPRVIRMKAVIGMKAKKLRKKMISKVWAPRSAAIFTRALIVPMATTAPSRNRMPRPIREAGNEAVEAMVLVSVGRRTARLS